MNVTFKAEDSQLKFYSKLSLWATLDTRSQRLFRGADARWTHAAVYFRKGTNAFATVLIDRSATETGALPFAPIPMNSVRWLIDQKTAVMRVLIYVLPI